jgi:hypothetical protein
MVNDPLFTSEALGTKSGIILSIISVFILDACENLLKLLIATTKPPFLERSNAISGEEVTTLIQSDPEIKEHDLSGSDVE